MALRDRHRGDGQPPRRYQMREKLLSIGDDYWVEDESGQRVFKVNGKAFHVRKTFVLEDPSGHEVAKIQERMLTVRDKMYIDLGIRDHYKIDIEDGPDLTAHGNFVDHEYKIEQDGDTVATVSKSWFRVRETYGVEIAADQNDALMLAITVCLDEMTRG